MPGDYKVTVSLLKRPDGTVVAPSPEKSPMQLMTEENAKESIPPQYSEYMKSRLKVTVPSSGGTEEIKITSK
jgi:hypothetical protein